MEPDYSKYSLSELYQTYNDIDKQVYPERALRLEREINARQSDSDSELVVDSESGRFELTEFKFIAVKTVNCVFVIPLLVYIFIDAILTGEIKTRQFVYSVDGNLGGYILFLVAIFVLISLLLSSLFVKYKAPKDKQ
ncbi:hypothetical protein [Thalassotalea montiporae]